ncbi:hypothetical protein C2W62_01200 [Candidatus Entotheonella serta]|nr:hypothetical protein C2W62_01200 [Candidatus Entotheonella serta]
MAWPYTYCAIGISCCKKTLIRTEAYVLDIYLGAVVEGLQYLPGLDLAYMDELYAACREELARRTDAHAAHNSFTRNTAIEVHSRSVPFLGTQGGMPAFANSGLRRYVVTAGIAARNVRRYLNGAMLWRLLAELQRLIQVVAVLGDKPRTATNGEVSDGLIEIRLRIV